MRAATSRRRSTVDASAAGDTGNSKGPLLARILVLLLVVYVAWVVVPLVWSSFLFRQAMQDEARYGPPGEQVSFIESRLLAEARSRGLDVDRNSLQVHKEGAQVRISAQYTVPMDFGAGLVWQWQQAPLYEGTRRSPVLQRK